MQKLLSRLLVLVMFMTSPAMLMQAQAPEMRKGVVRVKLQPEMAKRIGSQQRMAAKGKDLTTGVQALDAPMKKVKATSIKRLFPYAPKFEAQRAAYGLDRWYEISFDESVNPLEAKKILASTPGVQIADNVVPMVLKEGSENFVKVSSVAKAAAAGNVPFNDPLLSGQWHYHNDGLIPDTRSGADINLFEAWKTETGKPNVIVAIIDGGIDYKHEDLAANMCINEAELYGTPGVDDDGNGYVDDIYGYNFVTNSSEIYPHPHGTHVAGTVAAVNNNGVGVAGVAGGDGTPGSGVKMISCQVFDSRAGSGEGDFAKAIVYAAERGASIAQCSWGWQDSGYYEQAVLDAIDYFTETVRTDVMTGGLCIFAPGNDGKLGDFYPAAYDKVLAVTAMSADGRAASYSNHGAWADVVAPGGLMDYNQALGVLSTLPSNEYGFNEGTSMATPHVSGIAALVLSAHGKRDLLNETLRQQLVTSVNDFYALNPTVEGLFGSGYVDAAKALMMGNGKAPSAVGTFSLAPAQEEIVVEWTIPASSDNNVNHHVLYYSKEPFTSQSDLSRIPNVVVDTKFNSSGDTFSYELTGLSPLTTYYIALTAVDRWGNASPLSSVQSATTNAGPQMTVDAGFGLNLDIDALNSPVASASFTIGNEADGLLKWSTYKRTISASPASLNRPNPGKVVPFGGKLGAQLVKRNASLKVEDFVPSDFPVNMSWYEFVYAYIGDSDPKVPNSLAQMFTVSAETNPDGFNLTHVRLDGMNGADPTIQIYRGTNISSASLVYEMTPDFWSYNFQTALTEQLWFAPGESFWIVYHFKPSETLYPLGIGEAVDGYNENYSYMSLDNGATWTRLSDVLRNTVYNSFPCCFTVTAISQNPDWSSLLVLDPSEGILRGGETQEVKVSNDGQSIINGTYQATIRFSTNESDKNTISVPVSINATGGKADIIGPKVVNFGDLLVGQEKTISVEIFNKGYGVFSSSEWFNAIYSENVVSSSEHFIGPDYVNGGFPARNYSKFDVTFAPKKAGSHTGVLTFQSYDGREFKLTVQGVATDPAEITITPAVINAGELEVGAEATTAEFTISNTGNYPLEFAVPKFTDETIENQAAGAHKFGYTYISNLDGSEDFAYDNNPELFGATDITSQFSDDVYMSKAIDLGFEFPYYGTTYSKVYVTSFGGICFALPESPFRSPLTPDSYGVPGTGLISALGTQMPMASASRIEYAKQDGKFVVKFINTMGLVYDTDYRPISFHIALSSNGDVEIFYDDYESAELFQDGSTLFVGLNDMECADPLTVTSADMVNDQQVYVYSSFASGTAVKFIAPKPYFVKGVEPASGIVVPGESVKLTATLQASEEMYAGETFNNIAINSNDPFNPTAFVRFNAVITGDELLPVAALEKSAYDFGSVFRTSDAVVPVALKNAGRNTMKVTGVALSGNGFSTDMAVPFEIEAGMSKDILVRLATDKEGSFEGKLTVTTDCGEVTADLAGTVIGSPEITLSYEAINETVESGAVLERPLTITNSGDEPLAYSLLPNQMVEFPADLSENSKTNYVYTASVDDSSVKMEWVDIETNGIGSRHDFNYFQSHDFIAVELPFEFPFYGKAYKTMYVYNTGFISFTERVDQHVWPEPPIDFPGGSIYTNLIAPYWGMHSMDVTSTAGIYTHTEDDEAIVSFMEYGNSMNIGVCFQVILKSDGTFKFQYKGKDTDSIIYSLFGLGGISNADGSEGYKLPERTMQFGNAVVFAPVVETTLAPEQSKTIDIKLSADYMAGEYSSDLVLNTNVPHKEKINIPVNLTVTGTPEAIFPEDIHIVKPVGFYDLSGDGPLVSMGAPYEAHFKIENKGTAPFTIDYIEYESPMIIDPWFGDEMPAFELYAHSAELDWITGEPTGNYMWQPYMGESFTVGRDGAEFSIPNMNCVEEIGEWTIPVTFHISGLEGVESKTVKVTFTVTPAPVMALDREDVTVNGALPGDVIVETIKVSNYGEYPLTFTMTLDPSGEGENDEEGGGGIAPWSASVASVAAPAGLNELKAVIKPFETGKSSSIYDTPQDVKFSNALYHPVPASDVIRAFEFGSMNLYDDFKASTLYTSPEGGINITDIYTALNYKNLKNIDITYEIIRGDNPNGSTVLGRGTYHLEKMSDPNQGSFALMPLDKEVYIPEGQQFCVVITYPKGVATPTFLAQKAEAVVANRYMAYYDSYSWFDPATFYQDNYGSLGFISTCIERTEGGLWAKVLGDFAGATVEPGESVEISLELNVDRAPLDADNKVMLVFKSDDPAMGTLNLPVVLNKNQAPVISVEKAAVYVQENTTVETVVSVFDPEDEAFTVRIDDNGSLASVVSAEAENGEVAVDGTTLTVPAGAGMVEIKVALKAAYGDAGSYWFTTTATDVNGIGSSANVNYLVEHVNRAPQVVEGAPIALQVGSTSGVINLGDYFNDPDGDELTFSVEIEKPALVQLFDSGNSIILFGLNVGSTYAVVTATDKEELTATTRIPVEVTEMSGIDNVTVDASVGIYPNPVVETLNVVCDFSAADAQVSIFSTAGAKVLSEKHDIVAGEAVQVNVAALPAGNYVLIVEGDFAPRTAVIIKL